MPSFSVAALAKLNLSLGVTGRRPDGYHELSTTIVLVEVADLLTLSPGPSGLSVAAEPAERVPLDPQHNLAWRGLLAGAAGRSETGCLHLAKRIPSAAGLGGGSSDAAAAWRLGRRLVGRGETPTPSELDGELLALGADVPFFGSMLPAARVTGIGEAIEPLPPMAGRVVVAVPPFRLSTAAVYAELRPDDWSGDAGDREGRNDLLAPALRLRPELAELMRLVERAGGEPRLTGSGPACFAITDDDDRATAIDTALDRAGVRTMPTRIAARAGVIEAFDLEDAQDR